MSRKALDFKVVSTADAYTLAKFTHDLTLKGYEPLPLQCSKQFGSIVITMVLYEGENENTKESNTTGADSQAVDTVQRTVDTIENVEPKAEEGTEQEPEDQGVGEPVKTTAETAPKRVTRAKTKQSNGETH